MMAVVSELQTRQWLQMEAMATLHNLLLNVSSELQKHNDSSYLEHGIYKDLLEDFRQKLFTHKEPYSIVLISLYVPVFLLAFFGNLLVLMVVLPHKHMRSVTNCFIVNMAVSDLLGELKTFRINFLITVHPQSLPQTHAQMLISNEQ